MKQRSLVRLVSAALIGVAGCAAGIAVGAQEAKAPERTLKVNQVARVGGSVITAEEFIEKLTEVERALNPGLRSAKPALDLLIAERLLELEADRLEAVAKQREIGDERIVLETTIREEFQRRNDELLRDQRKRGAPERPMSWESYLDEVLGMTPAEFNAWLIRIATINLRMRLVVSYWEETSEHADAWGIRCSTREDAQELRDRAVKGENFRTLSTKSTEERSRESGGRLGTVWRKDGRLDDPVDEAFWKLKDGEISDPIQAQHGWWIVMRRNTVLANEAPLFQLREMLIKRPNVDGNRLQAWRNAVAASGRYVYERRMPGWDCAANQP